MARHNEVTMYGQVSSAPKIYTDKPGQPDAKRIQVICTVAVIRGIRDYGAKDHRIKMDNPIVLSQNAKIMKQMAKWEKGDMVLIRGTLASHDYTKHCLCKNEACEDEEGKHSVISFNETLSYVNPVFTEVLSKGLDPSEGTKNMRERSEISNRVTIIGKASNEPEIYTTDQGQRITNYVLDVPRKYRIKEDDDSNRHDFLIMKSYGKIADMDYRYIKKDGHVFVDGAIQVREYAKQLECPYCHTVHNILRTVTEVIPYSTEYGVGCRTEEEAEEFQTKKSAQEAGEVKDEIFS